jgi:hypothetical protein
MFDTPIDSQLPILDELGRELHQRALALDQLDAMPASRHAHPRPDLSQRPGRGLRPGRSPRLRSALARLARRPLLALPVIALLGGSVALAASGVLQTGSPVPSSEPLTPGAGVGVPAPGHSQLIAHSAPDPAGGLPWSMRLVHTSRDVVCVQIARLYDGQLGVIGEDGAFHDDHRFHPLPASAISAVPRHFLSICSTSGRTSLLEAEGVPASGELQGSRGLHRPSQERRVDFGLLGPHALSVSYRLHGRSVTVPVEPRSGAYLIVLPGASRGFGSLVGGLGGGSSGTFVPSGALTQITYRLAGRVCEVRPFGHPRGPHPCQHPAVTIPATPRALHRAIHVKLLAAPTAPGAPGSPTAPGAPGSPTAPGAPGARDARQPNEALVSFLAPFTVASARSAYAIEIPLHCRGGGVEVTALERNVRAGQLVRARTNPFATPCGRRMSVEVRYYANASIPLFKIPREGTLVGAASLATP